MKEEYLNLQLENNASANRFEMKVGDHRAIIEYQQSPGKITLLHTEVEPGLEGKGAATAIIEKTLAWIEANHIKLIPLCPLVVLYLKRHPEWKRILDESVTNI